MSQLSSTELRSLSTEQAEEKYPGQTDFVHLHCHTLFSILDGIAKPEEYFRLCAERKWPAHAITEHGVMNSIPDAYLASKEYNVKQILGCEIYYNDHELYRQEIIKTGKKLKDIKEEDEALLLRLRRNRHLTVLCKNMTGYENLL